MMGSHVCCRLRAGGGGGGGGWLLGFSVVSLFFIWYEGVFLSLVLYIVKCTRIREKNVNQLYTM